MLLRFGSTAITATCMWVEEKGGCLEGTKHTPQPPACVATQMKPLAWIQLWRQKRVSVCFPYIIQGRGIAVQKQLLWAYAASLQGHSAHITKLA